MTILVVRQSLTPGSTFQVSPVMKLVIVTLNSDMVNFQKLFTDLPSSIDTSSSPASDCPSCDKSKNQYEEGKSENINKSKCIVLLEEQIAKLKVRRKF